MSYISFYRKWRPQAFSEVVGQEHIVTTLQNAISKNRLVHGYMFCGPKGTGKTSIARIFAKAINCVNASGAEPCNKCDNCISITAGSNVDLVEIDAASNRKIEHIRDLRDKVKYLPTVLRKKIYIIDEVHMLTPEAFNALLKTLEEPPEHVIFMMATTHPQDVIPTILSRCQRFNFEPIPVDRIKNRLKNIAAIEKIDITDSALSMVAKHSNGSLRDADGILEQLSSFGDNRITVDEVSSLLGIIDRDMLFELANIILEKNINQGLLFVSRLFSTSFSLNSFISEFLEHLYSLYVIKNYENPVDILDMPDDFRENYYNQAGLFASGQLEKLIDLFAGLLAQIKDSENPKTFFKAAVIKALHTESVKGGQPIQNNQNIQNSQVNNNTSALQGTPAVPGPKIMNREADHQYNNKSVGANIGSENNVEATAPVGLSIETFDADEEITKKEMPGQKKTASAENISSNVARAETDKTGYDKTAQDKAEDKAYGESLTGVSVTKNIPETAPSEAAIKSVLTKSEPADSASDRQISGTVTEKVAASKDSDDFSHLIPAIWEDVLAKIKAKSVPLHAVLKEVKRFKVQGDKIFFSLEPKNHWHKKELGKLENRTFIQELLISLAGEKFEITFDFISDKNISESIDLVHQDRKIRTPKDLPLSHNDTTGLDLNLLNVNNREINASKNTAAFNEGPDNKDANTGSDDLGYFEAKFKVKEK